MHYPRLIAVLLIVGTLSRAWPRAVQGHVQKKHCQQVARALGLPQSNSAASQDGLDAVLKDVVEITRTGRISTGITLPKSLMSDIIARYEASSQPGNLADVNEFSEVVTRRSQATIDKLYAINRYADHHSLRPVLEYLLSRDLSRFFATRYMVISHDIMLSLHYGQGGFGRHVDLWNLQSEFNGPHDVSLYIPFTELNAETGGRLRVLPPNALYPFNATRAHIHALREIAERRWAATGKTFELDRMGRGGVAAFTKRAKQIGGGFRQLDRWTNVSGTSRMLDHCWQPIEAAAGEVILFNNKFFHWPEAWNVEHKRRDVYIVRMHPLYDMPVQLRSFWGRQPANRAYVDFTSRRVVWQSNSPVNVHSFDAEHRITRF